MMNPAVLLLIGQACALAWSPTPSSRLISNFHQREREHYPKTSSALFASTPPSTNILNRKHGRNPLSRLFPKKAAEKEGSAEETQTALYASSRPSTSTSLNNIVEDGLDMEIDEIEAELRVKKAINLRLENIKDAQDEIREKQREPPPMKTKDAASIIAGTAIGGGFLALPSVTSPIGYGPTALGLVASWGFLLLSAVAFIEAAGLVSDARSRREKSITAVNGAVDEDESEGGHSISSIIREAFGKKWGIVSGIAFIAQMVAIMTIQVVKGAAITSQITGLPYAWGCWIPSCIAGLFVFLARPEVVESVNTSLTSMMIGGFALLCVAAVAVGNAGAATMSPFARADWASLLPSSKVTWSIPVLMKLLAWGEAMPLLTERMVEATEKSSSRSSSNNKNKNNDKIDENIVNGETKGTINVRAKAQRSARTATALGASVPLILCLLWAAISTALVDPSSPDPITFLLSATPAISLPVGLLSIGAIGTTLLSSFLAMSHFASDVICTIVGHCDFNAMNIARLLIVAIPCLCACAGPGLYLPLLAFAGAYPTTLLYGLAPPLAALILRRRAQKESISKTELTPSLVPGGSGTLLVLAATAVSIVGACTMQAIRSLVKSNVGFA